MKFKRIIIPAIFAAAVGLSACGGGGNNASGGAPSSSGSDGSSPSSAASSPADLTGKIAAGGSSAQEKAQEAWRAGFGQSNPNVTITYDAVGSGTGQQNFVSGAYQFAGSDSPMDDPTLAKAKSQCGADPIEFPVYISPIDVAFNLKGVKSLNLDADTVAKIFSDKITKWNDPAIAALNKGTSLPSTAISPVHRSDSSGTTFNFTDYLSKAAPKSWKHPADTDWPSTKGESAEGTSGVVGSVQGGNGTIAYVDDSAVKGTKLGVAKIKVGSHFVAPSPDGASADLASSKQVSGTPDTVMTYNLDRTTTDPKKYPIFMASYEIACPSYKDATTTAIVKAWLSYIISENGQKAAAANAYSAPLPSAIASKEQAIINQMG